VAPSASTSGDGYVSSPAGTNGTAVDDPTIVNGTKYNDGGSVSSTSSSGSLVQTSPVDTSQMIYSIESYFMYMNFPFIVLQRQSTADYQSLLIIMNAIFIAFIAMVMFGAGRVFLGAKSGTLKDGTRIIARIFSILMISFLTVL
jgi:hypothetical protein